MTYISYSITTSDNREHNPPHGVHLNPLSALNLLAGWCMSGYSSIMGLTIVLDYYKKSVKSYFGVQIGKAKDSKHISDFSKHDPKIKSPFARLHTDCRRCWKWYIDG